MFQNQIQLKNMEAKPMGNALIKSIDNKSCQQDLEVLADLYKDKILEEIYKTSFNDTKFLKVIYVMVKHYNERMAVKK